MTREDMFWIVTRAAALWLSSWSFSAATSAESAPAEPGISSSRFSTSLRRNCWWWEKSVSRLSSAPCNCCSEAVCWAINSSIWARNSARSSALPSSAAAFAASTCFTTVETYWVSWRSTTAAMVAARTSVVDAAG